MLLRVNDLFTGTSGTALSTHAPDLGLAWAVATGTGVATLTGAGRAYQSSGTFAYYINGAAAGSFGTDYDVSADVFMASTAVAGDLLQIIGRSTGAGTFNYYSFLVDVGGTTSLIKYVAGVSTTTTGPTLGTWSVGVTRNLRISMVGSLIRCFVDGVLRITLVDSAVTSGAPAFILDTGAKTATTGPQITNFRVERQDVPKRQGARQAVNRSVSF